MSISAFKETICRSKVRRYEPHSSINLGETVNTSFMFAYQREIAVFILKETVNSFFVLFQEQHSQKQKLLFCEIEQNVKTANKISEGSNFHI